MKKIIFIAPHLSTGGLPQYLFKKMELLSGKLEIYCVEYDDITGGQLVVQRNRIASLLDKEHFITLGSDKMELMRIIERIKPDYVHLEEIPEYFMSTELADRLYSSDRNYKLFETSHDSSFSPNTSKVYLPDSFFFVSQWQMDQYKGINVPKYLAEYPIDYKQRGDRNSGLIKLGLDPNKKHVLNVGLFTARKNQGEIFEMARHFGDDVQFHFLGNQAGNFEDYWKPLMANKPSNCVVWGERNDTDDFYSCMDVFLFTSRGFVGNKETMPLVLREAVGWRIPIMMYNLDVYQNYFDKFDGIIYLNDNLSVNVSRLTSLLGVSSHDLYFRTEYNHQENKLNWTVLKEHPSLKKYGYRIRDAVNGFTYHPMGSDMDFVAGGSYYVSPNARAMYTNGLRIEFLDQNRNVIESHSHESTGQIKNHWWPVIWPKTELWIKDKKVDFHHDPNDHSAWWSFYETNISEDYKQIESGDVVVDVGANLGFLSLYAIRQGASRSYAIEPFPKTFEYLCKNVKDQPITTINCGIGSDDTYAEFFGGEVTSVSRLSDYEKKEGQHYYGKDTEKVMVRLKPFNQILEENGINFIDYLKVDCEGGEKELFETIDPDYLKYRVKKIAGEIHIGIVGFDVYQKIKNQMIGAGFDYSDNYTEGSSLAIFFAKRKPKIKLVHIVNNMEGDREKRSIESLSKLKEWGIDYSVDLTPLYTELPPKENCARPEQVSLVPGDYLLSPGHYGCYLGHKKAVCESGDDFDCLIVSECDTILQIPHREMAEKLEESYFQNIKYDLIYTSFGKMLPGYVHNFVEEDLFVTDRIVEAHLYSVSKPGLTELRNRFNTRKWDVADLWYNNELQDLRRGIYKKPYALQTSGVSYLDGWFKPGNDLHDYSVVFNPEEVQDVSVMIHTCDHYSWCWEGMYMAFKRYWNWDLGWKVYWCNEEMDLPFNDPRIIQIKTGKSADKYGFSNRLRFSLERIPSKYVLYMQEDMWPILPVDKDLFNEAVYKMRYYGWNCVKIQEKLWGNYDLIKTNKFVQGQRVLKFKTTSEYLKSHNPGVWDKQFLYDHTIADEDPFLDEMLGTVRISRRNPDPKIYHINHRWYYQPGASQGGTFNESMKQYAWYLKLSEDLKKEMDI